MSESGSDFGGATSDIYTALTVISTVFLLLGIITLAIQSQKLFDTWIPLGGV